MNLVCEVYALCHIAYTHACTNFKRTDNTINIIQISINVIIPYISFWKMLFHSWFWDLSVWFTQLSLILEAIFLYEGAIFFLMFSMFLKFFWFLQNFSKENPQLKSQETRRDLTPYNDRRTHQEKNFLFFLGKISGNE